MDAYAKTLYEALAPLVIPDPAPEQHNQMIYDILEKTFDMSKSRAQLKLATVMVDVITGQADDATIEIAADLEKEAPWLWKDNQWLRMVGGTIPGQMTKDWKEYLASELDAEHAEHNE